MATYYHGTSSNNYPHIERSVRKHGLCPQYTCPVNRSLKWNCDPLAVYLTPHPNVAAAFGNIIYSFRKENIPKHCKVENDPESRVYRREEPDTIKVEDCGCIKPDRKCKFERYGSKSMIVEIQEARKGGMHLFSRKPSRKEIDEWITRKCEWVKP